MCGYNFPIIQISLIINCINFYTLESNIQCTKELSKFTNCPLNIQLLLLKQLLFFYIQCSYSV